MEEQKLDTKRSMTKASAFFLVVLLLELPIAYLIYYIQGKVPGEYGTLVSILITQGYLLVAAILYLLITKTSLKRDLQIRRYKPASFFLSLVLLLTASPMASWLNVFSQLFAKNEAGSAIFDVTEVVPMWLGIMIIGCLPGFIEETIYRGIMLSAFRKRSILTGICISALSFGLMHMNFNQILYAIYLGLIFALLVEATGSLVSTMVLHMLFNGINTAYIYILPKMYAFLGQYSEEYANVDIGEMMNAQPQTSQLLAMLVLITPFAIGGLVLSWLLLKAIAKQNGRSLAVAVIRGDREAVSATKPVNVCLILGWIFCLIMAVSALFG